METGIRGAAFCSQHTLSLNLRARTMKTQRRHELQTNELADWLGKHIDQVKPYTQWIVGGVILVVVLIGVFIYFSREQSKQTATAWSAYVAATLGDRKPEDFAGVASKYGDSRAGAWAMQLEADLHLEEGSRLIYTDREEARDRLNKAKEKYEQVLKRVGDDAMLKGRARFGLAQAYECLGELKKANEQYEKLAEENKDTIVGQAAEQALVRLKKESTEKFYYELANYVPPESSEYDPTLDFLPDRPDLSYPGGDEGERAASAPTTGGGEFNPAGDNTPGPDLGSPENTEPDSTDAPMPPAPDEDEPPAPPTDAPKPPAPDEDDAPAPSTHESTTEPESTSDTTGEEAAPKADESADPKSSDSSTPPESTVPDGSS